MLCLGLGCTSSATAQATQGSGIVEEPCPPRLAEPGALIQLRERLLDPATTDLAQGSAYSDPDVIAYFKEMSARAAQDWAGLCRYRADNQALIAAGNEGRPRAVFMGNSITEYWVAADPAFFKANDYVGRGVSGQTTPQNLVRFRADVVALRPRVVHILAGTNDIAGNTGPTTLQDVENNIMSMVEIARANGIIVVLGAVTPAEDFPWRRGLHPARTIATLNAWMRKYAGGQGIAFVDYPAVLATPSGSMRPGLSADGVHPNRAGYALMTPLARKAIEDALASSR